MKKETGSGLIAIIILINVVGFAFGTSVFLYNIYQKNEKKQNTDYALLKIQNVLSDYVSLYNRLPCPAPLAAEIDDVSFGQEISPACNPDLPATLTSVAPQSQNAALQPIEVKGSGNKPVLIGTIPTRTLNISDKYMFDGYGNRLIYTVTEKLTKNDIDFNSESGGIILRDPNNNSLSSYDGITKYALISMLDDKRGAYNKQGKVGIPCDSASSAGENCDFNDAVFVSTLLKSDSDDLAFNNKIEFKDIKKCLAPGSKMDIFFLSDTTGSMGPHITKVKNKATEILSRLDELAKSEGLDVAFGVGNYDADPSERCSTGGYWIKQKINKNKDLAYNAIRSLSLGNGCDYPEGNFYALSNIVNNDALAGWRDKLGRIVIIMGDARSHTRSISQASIISSVKNTNTAIIALEASNAYSSGGGLNQGGQVSALANAVNGGVVLPIYGSNESQVADKIIDSIQKYLDSNLCS